jgi:ATP-dependent DNA helicase RecG
MSGDKLSKEGRARLEAMCATNDGFKLSELDLKLRGAGDIHGTQQSGEAFELNIANLATDTQIMQLTRDEALAILASDPKLERQENAPLRALRDRHHKRERIDFSDIS